MPNVSSKTKVVAFRVFNDAYAIIERRAKKHGILISEYLRNLVTNDAKRRR